MNHARRSSFVLAGALIACTLAGCSNGDTGSADGALVVYSPQGEGPRGEFIAQRASEELGIDVEFVSGGGGELTTRLLGERNNAQADVVLGLGEAQLYQLDDAELFAPFTPDWASDVPAEFQVGSEGFTLFSQTPIVMAYNPAELSDAPAAWSDLAGAQNAQKYVLPATTSQTGQAFLVGLLWRHADQATGEVSDAGWDEVKAIFDNAKPLADGAQMDWADVASGDQPIVVNWLGGIEVGASDAGIDMTIVDADGGSPFVSTGIGIVDGTDRRDQAETFVNWFGSADFQVAFVEATGNDTPVIPAALDRLPEAAAALEGIQKQDIDWGVVQGHLTEWLQKVELDVR